MIYSPRSCPDKEERPFSSVSTCALLRLFYFILFFFIFSGGKKTLHTHLRVVVRQNNWTGYITTEEERNYIGKKKGKEREREPPLILHTTHFNDRSCSDICLSLPNKPARLWHHAHNPTFGCVLSAAGGGWRIYTPKQNDRTRTARGKGWSISFIQFSFFFFYLSVVGTISYRLLINSQSPVTIEHVISLKLKKN